jgi:hypothetical protein
MPNSSRPLARRYEADEKKQATPKFAVPLAGISSLQEGRRVQLLREFAGVEYTLVFAGEDAAEEFSTLATAFAAVANKDEVKKRLKHKQVLSRRASTKFAREVAVRKAKFQPELEGDLVAETFAHVADETKGQPV